MPTPPRQILVAVAAAAAPALLACSDDVAPDPDAGVLVDLEGSPGEMGAADSGGSDTDMRNVRPDLDAGAPPDMTADLGRMPPADMTGDEEMSSIPEEMAHADMPPEDMTAIDMVMDDMTPADMTPAADMGTPVDMAAPVDMAPTAPCLSAAQGSHVARFRWAGNGPNSRAYVRYEVNTLPDTSRWKAGAYAQSFSYDPVFADTFLGEGGLELSGTTFMDIELSTQGLGSISRVTLGLYGRSYDTTSPGSFSWQTFSGTGASAPGSVFNSAPYQWYTAQATAAIPPNDGGILLRIRAEGPSGALIVNGFEICVASP